MENPEQERMREVANRYYLRERMEKYPDKKGNLWGLGE